jgi:hypothetical protein
MMTILSAWDSWRAWILATLVLSPLLQNSSL